MRRAPPVALGICVLVLILLAPTLAFAQSSQEKADAEALFNAAKTALASGNLGDACPKFAESQKKDPAIGTALYLAECYERIGKMASAWAQFRQAEDMANQRHDNRAPVAKARAERLSPSKLTIVLVAGVSETAGLEVKRDGEVISSALFGLASPIDGGKHVIVATAPGRHTFEWSGDIPEQRGAMTVTIPKLDPATSPIASNVTPTATVTVTPPLPTENPHPNPVELESHGLGGGKIAGIVLGVAGVVAIGVSSSLVLVAKGNYDGTSSPPFACTSNGCPDQNGVDARNSAKGLADLGTGLFIGGCVATVGGIVLFLVAPRPKPQMASLAVTPLVGAQGGGALLTGRF